MKEEMIPLLETAVEWAEKESKKDIDDPERRWIQSHYVWNAPFRARELSQLHGREVTAIECGTAYCIAGYIGQILEPGYALEWDFGGVDVDDFVEEKLGLTYDESYALFGGGNDIEDVKEIAARIIQGKVHE